jgi:hypothetical protein
VVLLARALATQGLTIKARAGGELHVVKSQLVAAPLRDRAETMIMDCPPSEARAACGKCGHGTFAVMLAPIQANGDGAINLSPARKCTHCGDVSKDASNFVMPSGMTDELSFGTVNVDSVR